MTTASAFGVKMGQRIEQLDVLEARGGGWYDILPPCPYPEFDKYSVSVAPTAGVYWIAAVGEHHQEDGSGRLVKRNFARLRHLLETKYGRYAMTNTIPGDIRPQEWVMAIREGAEFQSQWHTDYGSDLPDGLDCVYLSVVASDDFSAFVTINFSFSNFLPGQTEIDVANPL